MAGKQGTAMNKAQKLIEAGTPAPEAARKAGVALGSIYLRPWWKAMQESKKGGAK